MGTMLMDIPRPNPTQVQVHPIASGRRSRPTSIASLSELEGRLDKDTTIDVDRTPRSSPSFGDAKRQSVPVFPTTAVASMNAFLPTPPDSPHARGASPASGFPTSSSVIASTVATPPSSTILKSADNAIPTVEAKPEAQVETEVGENPNGLSTPPAQEDEKDPERSGKEPEGDGNKVESAPGSSSHGSHLHLPTSISANSALYQFPSAVLSPPRPAETSMTTASKLMDLFASDPPFTSSTPTFSPSSPRRKRAMSHDPQTRIADQLYPSPSSTFIAPPKTEAEFLASLLGRKDFEAEKRKAKGIGTGGQGGKGKKRCQSADVSTTETFYRMSEEGAGTLSDADENEEDSLYRSTSSAQAGAPAAGPSSTQGTSASTDSSQPFRGNMSRTYSQGSNILSSSSWPSSAVQTPSTPNVPSSPSVSRPPSRPPSSYFPYLSSSSTSPEVTHRLSTSSSRRASSASNSPTVSIPKRLSKESRASSSSGTRSRNDPSAPTTKEDGHHDATPHASPSLRPSGSVRNSYSSQSRSSIPLAASPSSSAAVVIIKDFAYELSDPRHVGVHRPASRRESMSSSGGERPFLLPESVVEEEDSSEYSDSFSNGFGPGGFRWGFGLGGGAGHGTGTGCADVGFGRDFSSGSSGFMGGDPSLGFSSSQSFGSSERNSENGEEGLVEGGSGGVGEDTSPIRLPIPEGGALYVAVYPFEPEAPQEMRLDEGEVVRVWEKICEGWVVAGRVRAGDEDKNVSRGAGEEEETGLVPENYLSYWEGQEKSLDQEAAPERVEEVKG